MVKNSRAVTGAMLRGGLALGFSLILGYLIDGVYLGFLLLIPALGAARTFKRKTPTLKMNDDSKDLKKAAVMLYYQISTADDIEAAENAAIYAKSTNPQFPIALMIDLDDQPIREVREDTELVAQINDCAKRLNVSGGFCLVVRRRTECRSSLEFIGKGRKTGALLDLMRIIKGEEISPLAIFGDVKILDGAEYIMTVADDDSLCMDSVSDMLRYTRPELGVMYPENDERFHGTGLVSIKALESDLPCEKILFCDRLISGALGEGKAPIKLKKDKASRRIHDRLQKKSQASRRIVQEFSFLFSRRLKLYQKFEILGELADILTPTVITVIMLLSFSAYPPAMGAAATAAMLMYLIPRLCKKEDLLGEILLVPTYASVSVFAAIKESWRMISGKNTLRTEPIGITWHIIAAEVISLLSLRSPSELIRLIALITALLPIRLIFDSLPEKQEKGLGYHDKKALEDQLALMWQFFSDHVNDFENHLPPESVRFDPDGIKHSATPGGIGVYMLSCLASCDKKLIDAREMSRRLEMTLNTVLRLDKQNGNLYESYDTRTLLPLSKNLSDEESGLYLACLICLKEGLDEYTAVCKPLGEIIQKLDALTEECDLSFVSNDHLFSSGRLASFLGVACRALERSHWENAERKIKAHGFKTGIISRYGGIDEYFLSELFIGSPKSSAADISLDYCLYCHKRLSQEKDLPFGLSHSRFDAVDENMHYLSRAHGAADAAQNNCEGYVVSPYSSYLTLERDPSGSLENLSRLASFGMLGKYGYYEAIDFDSGEAVMCYDSKHIGLSIIAIINATNDKIMQKRMLKNSFVKGAQELLAEEMPKSGAAVFEAATAISEKRESFRDISLFAPRVRFCHSKGYTFIMTDSSECFGIYKGDCAYIIPDTLYDRRGGIKISISQDGKMMSRVPELCEFFGGGADYFREEDGLALGIKAVLCSGYPCEQRIICLENTGELQKSVTIEIEFASDNLNGISVRGDSIILRSGKMYIQAGFIGNNKARILPSRKGFSARTSVNMPPKTRTQLSMYILLADTLEELKQNAKRFLSEPVKAAASPKQSAARRKAEAILSAILFGEELSQARINAICSCSLPSESVKDIGISEKLPLVAVNLNGKDDRQKCELYLSAFKALSDSGIDISLVFIYNNDSERRHYNELIDAVKKEGLEGFIYSQIMPVELESVPKGMFELLLSRAVHVCDDIQKESGLRHKSEPLKIDSSDARPGQERRENAVFGTIITDGITSLSYAHDSSSGVICQNERIFLRLDGKLVCLPMGVSDFGEVRIEAAKTAMCKRISVKLNINAELIYYAEPCIGKIIRAKSEKGNLTFDSPDSPGIISISSSKNCTFITDKAAFFSGQAEKYIAPSARQCAAVSVKASSGKQIDFYLSYAATKNAAFMMPELFERQAKAKPYDKNSAKILRMCLFQFVEGDTAHDYATLLNGKRRATRTVGKSSATRLLSEVLAYLESGGDAKILQKPVRYSRGLSLGEGEVVRTGEVYNTPFFESVYEHLVRAAKAFGEAGEDMLAKIDAQRRKDQSNAP